MRMQKEIEIKIKLNAKEIHILQDWLLVNAKNLGVHKITDYYLDNPRSSFYFKSKKGFKDALNHLRVRFFGEKNFVCYKKRTINEQGSTVCGDELETEVFDGNSFLEMFKLLGFADQVVIKKVRNIFLFENKFEIVIDEVDNLGTFVEIELKNFNEGVDHGMQEIYGLLKKVGIKEFILFDRGYLCMTLNSNYDFGTKVVLE
jgi:predicted adenylyl cyclase CyaB